MNNIFYLRYVNVYDTIKISLQDTAEPHIIKDLVTHDSETIAIRWLEIYLKRFDIKLWKIENILDQTQCKVIKIIPTYELWELISRQCDIPREVYEQRN